MGELTHSQCGDWLERHGPVCGCDYGLANEQVRASGAGRNVGEGTKEPADGRAKGEFKFDIRIVET